MIHPIKDTYKDLDDLSLLGKIINEGNEEAAVHLLYARYYPLFLSLCKDVLNENYCYLNTVLSEYYLYLKGADSDWNKLRTFGGKCHFANWFKCVSRRFFIDYKKNVIDKGNAGFSLYVKGSEKPMTNPDDDEEPDPEPQIPEGGEEEYERHMRHVKLMEAIRELKNPDQRFVILKYLEGYSSKETANLLQVKWTKTGETHIEKDVKPTEGYVNVLRQRAKEELQKILTKD